MRNGRWMLWGIGGVLALGLAGCASSINRTSGLQAPTVVPETSQTRWVQTRAVVEDAMTDAAPPAVETLYTSCGSCDPCAPKACAPDPCAPPPPLPECYSGCGLPCEKGISSWHLRGVGGYAFSFGEDAGSNCGYAGVDLGFTTACCWGVDLFYRTHSTSFDNYFKLIGAPSFLGEDAGRFHHIGLKATYQRSISNSRWFGYGGLGVQYFWTSGYLEADDGWGGFGELGFGYVLSSHWRLRAGVETLVQSTDILRKDPPDTGDSRLLWFASPVVQIELAW